MVYLKEVLFLVSGRMKEEREGASVQEGRTQPGSAAGERAESCAVCSIKLSSSTEPKLLPCLHMMCKGCVLNTSEDKHSTGKRHARVSNSDS